MDESICELAHDTHVSTATVIRFCKKMGCSGFLELKYKLKDHIHTQSIKSKQDTTNFMSFVAYTNTKHYQDGIQRAAEIIQSADNFFCIRTQTLRWVFKICSAHIFSCRILLLWVCG